MFYYMKNMNKLNLEVKIKMKDKIELHLAENLKNYFILGLILIIGIIIGIISVNNLNEEQKCEINNYLNEFAGTMKNNSKIDYSNLLEKSIKENIRIVILIVLFGFSIWSRVGITSIIGYKGFSLGYSISGAIIAFGVGKGILFSTTLLLLSQVLLVPAILYISIKSIKTYKLLISETDEKKVLLIKYGISLISVIVIMLISSFIETYLNSNLFMMFIGYY